MGRVISTLQHRTTAHIQMKKTHSVTNLIQLVDCMCMRENALFNAGGAARGGEPAAAAAAQHGAPVVLLSSLKLAIPSRIFF